MVLKNASSPASLVILNGTTIDIWRCATVVKGGKRFSFAVMSVIGNGAGIVYRPVPHMLQSPMAQMIAAHEARFDEHANFLIDIDYSDVQARYGAPYYFIHRADLINLLVKTAPTGGSFSICQSMPA